MLEGLREALNYVVDLGKKAEEPKVLEICGKTYATRELVRYGKCDKASAIEAHTLSALVEYIERCGEEFQANMLIHVVSPKEVRLISTLDENRTRETLFISRAEVSEFSFDLWYDQERFMIELQANFLMNNDLAAVMKMAGNIDKNNSTNFTDDGVTQVATINVGGGRESRRPGAESGGTDPVPYLPGSRPASK